MCNVNSASLIPYHLLFRLTLQNYTPLLRFTPSLSRLWVRAGSVDILNCDVIWSVAHQITHDILQRRGTVSQVNHHTKMTPRLLTNLQRSNQILISAAPHKRMSLFQQSPENSPVGATTKIDTKNTSKCLAEHTMSESLHRKPVWVRRIHSCCKPKSTNSLYNFHLATHHML